MDFLEGPRPIGKQQLRPTYGGNTLWRGLVTLGVRGLKKSELLIFSRSPLRLIEKEKKTECLGFQIPPLQHENDGNNR
jgi:hypothetical protein